ncbi:MAG: hypothetical protein GEU90_03110 [Gemmatimonas sp.]|nr:hypothetical protein [Gemmatimonas sp.]
MPLRLVRAPSNRTLWNSCRDRFLAAAGTATGPRGHRAHLWITHRGLRDSLLEQAFELGIRGWLDPPISFFSELPERFQLSGKPTGLLTRRRLVARLASKHADRLRIGTSANRGIIRGHMMDGLLGELLPEGVEPGRLSSGLAAIADDDFTRRRNDWVGAVYREYLEELSRRDQFDPRSVHALLATSIDQGNLSGAIGGAPELHIYGLYGLRSRERFISALATQRDVSVALYTLLEDEPGEWDDLAQRLDVQVEILPGKQTPDPAVIQPAPDALREYGWITAEVKRQLTEGGIEPHEIAVVAREGRVDTRLAYTALESAGIPCTARVRMQLSNIGALKAVLELFRGAATEWSYRPLRNVLTSPYFQTGVDLRGIDFVAAQRRLSGLQAWADALERVVSAKEDPTDRDARGLGVHRERLLEDAARLRSIQDDLAMLDEPRSERQWAELTIRLLGEGVLDLRRRASQPVANRWDVVRFDQRGIRQLDRLLREWSELDLLEDPLAVSEWHRLLQRMLEAHELALSTPGQKGVQVVEAQDAALTPFRAIYVTHANDGEFPRPPLSQGVLLEEERAALRRAGLPIADRELSLRRERTLWRAAVQADSVAITYRTTDPAGTPLLPSLMVPDHDPSNELPRSFEPIAGADEGARDQVASPEEARRLAAVRLRRTAGSKETVECADTGGLQRAIVAAHAEVRRGVRLESARPETAANPWQGELRDPALLQHLAHRYGPDHVWSASQLEAYATSPFIFLVDRVLRLRPMEEAAEETTPLTFGGVAHDLLERFYDATLNALPVWFDEVTQEAYDRLADEIFSRLEAEGRWVGLPVLWRHAREEIRAKVREYLAWEVGYLQKKGERPVWCELELVRDGEPITLTGMDLTGSPRVMRFTGRIDRIDLRGVGESACYDIVDYKSSTYPSSAGYTDGSVMQAVLYLEGVAHVKGVSAGRGRYRVIKRPGNPQNGCQIEAGKADYLKVLRVAFTIPERVQRGIFEPAIAKSQKWLAYHPGIDVVRTRAQIEEGSRFDG